jgi:nucleotide-binding universal stress UspA family protein
VSDGVEVTKLVKTGAAAAEIANQAQKVGADLIVMGRGGGRAVRDVFLGSTAERVLRRARIPVLVVRLPVHGPYRRPLLALDTDQAAPQVVKHTLQVVTSPRPRLGLVHAYDIPYYGMVYPSLEDRGRELREYYREKALHEVAQVLAIGLAGAKASIDEELRWKSHIRHGSPRTVIPETVTRTRTDLLVMGTHGHAGMAHALLGTAAGDVLRDVKCDVLVVPPGSAKQKRRDLGMSRQMSMDKAGPLPMGLH